MEVKIKVNSTGLVWHYHHFLADFLLPYFRVHQPGVTTVYTTKNVGSFKGHFEQFFDVKLQKVDDKTFKSLPCKRLVTHSIRKQKFAPHMHNRLINYIETKWNLKDESYPTILLVDRKVQKLKFAGKVSKDNGANRRRIRNHGEVADKLASLPGFKNVILEFMPFSEQIKHFYNAKVVIGQHGAGLTNLMFTKGPATAIMLAHKNQISTWWRPCFNKKNGIKLVRFGNGGSKIRVDANDLYKVVYEHN